jgi:hypothetical protein
MLAILHRLQCKPRFAHETDTAHRYISLKTVVHPYKVKQFFIFFLTSGIKKLSTGTGGLKPLYHLFLRPIGEFLAVVYPQVL